MDGIVVGNCRLEDEIGRGGTGTVYRGRQLAIDRPVAVKLIPVAAEDSATIDRFEREARAAGALDHPHSLPIYAAGEQDGLLFLVMRLVDGPDLAGLVARDGPLAPVRAVTLIEQVAGALDAAHAAGLVHRDIKPANVLVERRGRHEHAWLSDFGLTRPVAEADPGGGWSGTPDFAAPEQLRGDAVGPAADIYALGGVLRSALGPDPPERLRAVIARAMADDPADRFASAADFAHAAGGAVRRRRVDPRLLGVLAAVLAAIVVAVILLAGGGPDDPTTAGTPTYTFRQPAGWRVVISGVSVNGVRRTITADKGDRSRVEINRVAATVETIESRARASERMARATPGYRLVKLEPARVAGRAAYEWAFTLPGARGRRFFVFRRIGATLYGVLGMSDSLPASRSDALLVAGSLRPR